MAKTSLLFDLDGTLTDPQLGITSCIRYALGELGLAAPPAAELHGCIGPPLLHSFAKLLGPESPHSAQTAVDLYRLRFAEVGLFENTLYPEIPAVLAEFRRRGKRLFVATSKPTLFARRIVEYFGLAPYFERVYGSELDGRFSVKTDLIGHVLREEKLTAADTAMIGDREFDVFGGKAHGLFTVGAAWGYGPRAELETAGADCICSAPSELLTVCE